MVQDTPKLLAEHDPRQDLQGYPAMCLFIEGMFVIRITKEFCKITGWRCNMKPLDPNTHPG